jgi:hypothetical protein
LRAANDMHCLRCLCRTAAAAVTALCADTASQPSAAAAAPVCCAAAAAAQHTGAAALASSPQHCCCCCCAHAFLDVCCQAMKALAAAAGFTAAGRQAGKTAGSHIIQQQV